MRFEWDENKNRKNIQKHGIAFEDAVRILIDPAHIERYDVLHSINEDRWIAIGFVEPRLLFMVYVIKQNNLYRIISARKANAREEREYCGL